MEIHMEGRPTARLFRSAKGTWDQRLLSFLVVLSLVFHGRETAV